LCAQLTRDPFAIAKFLSCLIMLFAFDGGGNVAGDLGACGPVVVGRWLYVSRAQVRAELRHHVKRQYARRTQRRSTPSNTQTAASSAIRMYRRRCCYIVTQKNWTLFYLSTTLANTVRFLPRDAMHKRGLCRHAVSVSVCLSVRLSRLWVVSKRIKIYSNFFNRRAATPILVFSYRTGWRFFDEPPPSQRGRRMQVW